MRVLTRDQLLQAVFRLGIIPAQGLDLNAVVAFCAQSQVDLDRLTGRSDHKVLVEGPVLVKPPVVPVARQLWRLVGVSGVEQRDFVELTGLNTQDQPRLPFVSHEGVIHWGLDLQPQPGGRRTEAAPEWARERRPCHRFDLLRAKAVGGVIEPGARADVVYRILRGLHWLGQTWQLPGDQ